MFGGVGLGTSERGHPSDFSHLSYGRMRLKGVDRHVDFVKVPDGYFSTIDGKQGVTNILNAMGLEYPEMVYTYLLI